MLLGPGIFSDVWDILYLQPTKAIFTNGGIQTNNGQIYIPVPYGNQTCWNIHKLKSDVFAQRFISMFSSGIS
jgi:hypothetical protein